MASSSSESMSDTMSMKIGAFGIEIGRREWDFLAARGCNLVPGPPIKGIDGAFSLVLFKEEGDSLVIVLRFFSKCFVFVQESKASIL
ncbi:hypothetical protein [Acinetobacter indicus]|uniref:hypothetical protein n=1 Tax=Acinetobacter indicus TaxID=756892 RepID=UPI0014439C0F|nr:hypothetical protein [Acinetobacter indicus]